MESKLTIDFGNGRSVLDTTTPPKPWTPQEDILGIPSENPFKIDGFDLLTKKMCPSEHMVHKTWSPKWDEYIHTHKYNYSITINTDPKAKWYKKITDQDRVDDHIIVQQIRDEEERRLKKLIGKAHALKLIKNCTIVYELGDNNKKHYHMLVYTARKNAFKMLIEQEFEMSMEPHGSGWKTSNPINVIRPKKMKKCFDCRSALEKAKEVISAIDYIIYTYYQKENLGENLLLNLISVL